LFWKAPNPIFIPDETASDFKALSPSFPD